MCWIVSLTSYLRKLMKIHWFCLKLVISLLVSYTSFRYKNFFTKNFKGFNSLQLLFWSEKPNWSTNHYYPLGYWLSRFLGQFTFFKTWIRRYKQVNWKKFLELKSFMELSDLLIMYVSLMMEGNFKSHTKKFTPRNWF